MKRKQVKIKDNSKRIVGEELGSDVSVMADENNPLEVGAGIPGTVLKVLVNEGDTVKEGQSLVVIEAMKMETNITASASGTVESVFAKEGQQVKSGELLIRLSK